MRIISGKAGGVRLETTDSGQLRPMLGRVREALFNIVRFELPGAPVLDLFAGSGSLGLEAVSQGAAHAVLVESEPDLVQLIEKNIDRCGFGKLTSVVHRNFFFLPMRPAPGEKLPADIVFVDPPYVFIEDPNKRDELFQILDRMVGHWIGQGGLVVLHHAPMAGALWPTRRFRELEKRVYGRSQLTFFQAEREHEDGSQE
ncbi:MAG: 16S rRNA (guanine(966)-N(2))-methyltransferase RsmD [Planctomycetes bacterium]|nr:16S rRNA (guanine(966)-N(2))-methyltransferase RsmD [Planctomycetota bacterium]